MIGITSYPNIDLRLLKTSYQLDADILANLSGALMNRLVAPERHATNYSVSPTEAEDFVNALSKRSVLAKEPSASLPPEFVELRDKMKHLCASFDAINRERKAFREIVVEMLRVKFWSLLADEKAAQFFLGKLGGTNSEILQKRLQSLESALEEAQSRLKSKDTELKEMGNERALLIKRLDKANNDLKRFILEEAKNKNNTLDSNTSNSCIPVKSITIDPPPLAKPISIESSPNGKPFTTSSSRVWSKKDSLVSLNAIGCKENSVARRVKGRVEAPAFADEYIEPDLESVQPLYQAKPKSAKPVRGRK